MGKEGDFTSLSFCALREGYLRLYEPGLVEREALLSSFATPLKHPKQFWRAHLICSCSIEMTSPGLLFKA